jgi:hypothetical protein
MHEQKLEIERTGPITRIWLNRPDVDLGLPLPWRGAPRLITEVGAARAHFLSRNSFPHYSYAASRGTMAHNQPGEFQMVKFQSWAAAALVIGFAITIAACGGDDEAPKPATRPSKPEPPLTVESSGEGEIRYSGETESGDEFKAQIGGDVSLPVDFGSDLPAYPGAVTQSAIETTGGTAIAALESDASADDIIDFYRDHLGGNGWSIESVDDLGRGTLLTATKGEHRVMVNAESMDQGARFTLSVGAGNAR